MVARWAHNPKVVSSNLAPATKKKTSHSGSLLFFMEEKFTVYVLYSQSFDKIYIGFTTDLYSRLESHNLLAKKGWTVKFRPWKVLYTEIYELFFINN